MDTPLDGRDLTLSDDLDAESSSAQAGEGDLPAGTHGFDEVLEKAYLEAQPRPGAPTFGSRGAAGRAAHVANALHEAPKYTPGRAIGKVSYTHDAMIDAMIQDPAVKEGTLAAMFGYTPGWVSQVISSDAFKARLEQRKEELTDPRIRMTLNEKFQAAVNTSLDKLQEKLAAPQVSDELLLQSIALGAKALGLGGNRAPILVQPSEGRLERLAERLLVLSPQQPQGDILDVQAKQVRTGTQG